MSLRPLLLFALPILAGRADAQAGPSRDDVLAQPTIEVARALLADVASRFTSMVIDRNGSVPVEVAFGTTPMSSVISGLCEATVLRIDLVREEDRSAPASIRDYSVSQVYKVVGQVDGSGVPDDLDEAAKVRACAGAGPVLARSWYDNHDPRFFTYNGPGIAYWLPVAALQGAIRRAHDGHYGPIECERRTQTDCRNPQAELGALDLRNLRRIDAMPVDAFAMVATDFHVRAYFITDDAPARVVSFNFNGLPLPGDRMGPGDFVFGRTRLGR